MAEEEMVRLLVAKLLALHPVARLDVFESAQICVVPDVSSNLYDDESAHDEERAPHAVEKKQREHQVWHDEILPLRAEHRQLVMVTRGIGLLALSQPAPTTF